jgi:hypothetical protein
MKISTIVFQQFYNLLIRAYAHKILSKKILSQISFDGAEVWDSEVNGVSPFASVFAGHTDCRYFYKKKGPYSPAIKKYGTLKEDIAIAAFELLGIKLPHPNVGHGNPSIKAEVYYQLFVEKHMPEFFMENENEIKIYNHENGLLLIKERKKLTKNETMQGTANTEMNLNHLPIIKVINDFYNAITRNKYDQAWQLLAQSFQNRVWKEKYDSFKIGYANTLSINNVHIWDLQMETSTARCKVYYEDTVNVSSSLELGHLEKLTISQLPEFVDRIEKLLSASKNTQLKGFENIELHKFFEPAVSEYIWYKCGMNPDAVLDLLPSVNATPIPRLYHFSMVEEDSCWLIKSITPIKSHLVR